MISSSSTETSKKKKRKNKKNKAKFEHQPVSVPPFLQQHMREADAVPHVTISFYWISMLKIAN